MGGKKVNESAAGEIMSIKAEGFFKLLGKERMRHEEGI